MKRKIAFLLAAAMTVSMLPMNAFASSSNSVTRTDITVTTDGDPAEVKFNGEPATIEVRPNNAVLSGDSIILNIDNGEFDKDLLKKDEYNWSYKGKNYETFLTQLNASGDGYRSVVIQNTDTNTGEMPYGITFLNANQIQVSLAPIDEKDAGEKDTLVPGIVPRYRIKLPIDVQNSSEGAVTVSIDNNYTMMTSGSYTVATVTDSDGSTTSSVSASDVRVTSDSSYDVPTITIKEDVANTFTQGTKITLKTNGKFEFDGVADVDITPGVNAANENLSAQIDALQASLSSNNRTITIELNNEAFNTDTHKRSRVVGINVEGLKVFTDDDDNYGKIEITVDGSKGITRQVIEVGERADYGFDFAPTEEVPTIFAGRSYLRDADLDKDDFATAEFEFTETTPGTWLDGRSLEFTVPDGVKILAYEVPESKYMNKSAYSSAKLTDDGTTLKFSNFKGALDETECSYLDLKLYITTAADYSGDVTVDVAGAGLDKDQIKPITVAKVVSPVTVEATPTESNIGYKAVETSDIKITENEYGALLEQPVYVKLDDTYYADIAFDDTDVDYTVDGEVEVKNFKVTSGEIHFTVDTASYNNPSTITITGVKVGTTRSIPYGSYSIIVGGEALVNNYQEDVDVNNNVTIEENQDVDPGISLGNNDEFEVVETTDANGNKTTTVKKKTPTTSEKDYDLFEVEGFEFKDYLTVKTETGTLDGKVEVQIGSNTIKMDGKEVAMDTAAYIQTASNSTMVPLRFVALAIGVDQDAVEDADNTSKIAWDANNKVATILYAAGNAMKIIKFQANSPIMEIDGTSVTMDNGVKAEIVDGRMFVPFRALGQALGVPVSWDAETRTAIYN